MKDKQAQVLERALAREKAARKAAEQILEEKSRELYYTSEKLKNLNDKLESLVKEKTSQLKGVFETIIDAFVVVNLQGGVLKLNEAAENLFGYTAQDKINLLTIVQKEDKQRVISGFSDLILKGSIKDFKVKINTANNTQKLVHVNASVIYDSDNNPIAANGIVRDITEEAAYERKLFDSQSRLSTLISSLEIGVLLEDENRDIVIANERFCDFFNIPVSPDMLIGSNCGDAAEQSKHLFKNPNQFADRIDEIILKKEQILGDEVIMNDGKILERDFIPIYQDGHYGGHLWTYKDITLNRKFRANIEAQKEKYSNIITNMNLGLVEVNTEDQILTVNEAFEKMSGYTETFLIGNNASTLLLENVEKGDLNSLIENLNDTESNTVEVKIRKKNKELSYWLLSSAPNYDLNANLIGYIWIHLDITKIRNLEEQQEALLDELARSNDELQEYAHVVSHDLKSPLRSINALVNWIKEDNEGALNEMTQKNLGLIELTLEKMEQLISDVLIYSSLNEKESLEQSVDTQEVLDDIFKLIHIPDTVTITVKDKMPLVTGNKVRIQQIFQNLISNAIFYNDKEQSTVAIGCTIKGDNYQFYVADNGVGIEKKYHQKIFKIFQTLHTNKGSTGIGLSIVNKIVKMHEGNIWLESEVGKGTTFFFTLPKK